jgi:hypothetical protein
MTRQPEDGEDGRARRKKFNPIMLNQFTGLARKSS